MGSNPTLSATPPYKSIGYIWYRYLHTQRHTKRETLSIRRRSGASVGCQIGAGGLVGHLSSGAGTSQIQPSATPPRGTPANTVRSPSAASCIWTWANWPAIIRKIVDFPAPLEPTSPTFPPFCRTIEASMNRSWWPWCLLMLSRRIMGECDRRFLLIATQYIDPFRIVLRTSIPSSIPRAYCLKIIEVGV